MSITVTQQTAPWQPVVIKIDSEYDCSVLAKLCNIAAKFTEKEMQDLVELLDDKHYSDMQRMFVRLSNSLNNYVND
jgi:hypothetical protein